jgi:hypothetical protein
VNPYTLPNIIRAGRAETLEKYNRLNGPKAVTVGNEGDLVFGEIGADTDVQLTFEYVATEDEGFPLAVGLRYDGDDGAFTYKEVNGEEFATPVALVDGDTFWIIVPPDTSPAAPYDLMVTALDADTGVEKSGTLSLVDRYTPGTMTPLRTLATLTLSKTAI